MADSHIADSFVVVDQPHRDGSSPSATDNDSALVDSLVGNILTWFQDPSSWTESDKHRIVSRRNRLPDSQLFFDQLLNLAQIDHALYPPTNPDSLSQLLRAIFDSATFDHLKQLSFVYYLLLDFGAPLHDQDAINELHSTDTSQLHFKLLKADAFASKSFILPHFRQLMLGYWLLDNGLYEDAIPFLASPDFIPKIIRTLFLPNKHNSRSSLERSRLLLRFLRTSTQPSSSPDGTDEYLQELEMQVEATSFAKGPTRALSLVRELVALIEDKEQLTDIRSRLMSKVYEHCFAPPKASAIKNLLASPLDPQEEVALETFVLSPPPSMSSTWAYIAADVLIIRFINQGRYMDAVRLDRRLGPDVSQGHFSSADHVEKSRLIEQRKKMIAGAREILPQVQKELLRIEESIEISGGRQGSAQEQVDADGDELMDESELKMSWEKVPRAGSQPDFAAPLTPLSASKALRSSIGKSSSTQTALLSAVVRASASPKTPQISAANSTPVQETVHSTLTVADPSQTEQPKTQMMGFLAKSSLAFGQNTPSKPSTPVNVIGNSTAETLTLVDRSPEPLKSGPSSPFDFGKRSGYKLSSSTTEAADKPVQTNSSNSSSPWRNKPSLTSTSPFSGQLKIPTSPLVAKKGETGQPFTSSPINFRPANLSPFVTAGVSSFTDSSAFRHPISASPLAFSSASRLPSPIGIVSQQNRARLDRDNDQSMDQDDQDNEDEGLGPDPDHTFVGHSPNAKPRTSLGADMGIGRLIPGRGVGRKKADEASDMMEQSDMETSENLVSNARRAGKSRSRVEGKAGKPMTSMSGLDEDKGGVRQTRSSNATNRKPLTLSNLAANERQQSMSVPRPIARRTRAATAELESLQGDDAVDPKHDDNELESIAEDAVSTTYTASEVGEEKDGLTSLARSTRRTKRTTTSSTHKPTSASHRKGKATSTPGTTSTKTAANIRRSSRLSSVEPETLIKEEEVPSKRKSVTKSRTPKTKKLSEFVVDEEMPTTDSAGVRTRSGRRIMPGGLDDH